MKKSYLIILFIAINLKAFTQIRFEKGYFIDNNNQITKCFIKNVDWQNNPSSFTYKLIENGEAKTGALSSVKEFGIDDFSKYLRVSVSIDRSSENIKNLSNERTSDFSIEQLYLKVLVEGKATLYIYDDKNLRRLFYSIDQDPIRQLVYKRYITSENKIGENNEFRSQLWKSLKCESLSQSDFKKLNYYKNQLVNVFIKYNTCKNERFQHFEVKNNKSLFNITLKTRLSNNSLKNIKDLSPIANFDERGADFSNSLNVEFGFEIESVFKFNKNKWAFIADLNYHYLKDKISTNPFNGSSFSLDYDIDYRALELALGGRHYLFLNNKSKLFINAFYVINLPLSSKLIVQGGSIMEEIDIQTSSNFAFGLGYRYNNKYSIELRIQTPRDLLKGLWDSSYTSTSIIIGYTIF